MEPLQRRVELAHNLQSPDIPSHTQVREPQCNEAPGTTSGARFWGPRSAMEAINHLIVSVTLDFMKVEGLRDRVVLINSCDGI